MAQAPNDRPAVGPVDPGCNYPEPFAYASDCRLVTDRHGVIREANDAAVLLLECQKDILIGQPLSRFVAPGDRAPFDRHLGRLSGGERAVAFESRVGDREPWRDILTLAVRSDANDLCWWVLRDITRFKRALRERADLIRKLVTAQEDERRRISRELHDSIGQLLAGLTMAVKAARVAELPPRVHAVLDDVQRMADDLGRATHDLAVRLRPTTLDDLGLVPALEQLLTQTANRAPFEVDFHAQGMDGTRFVPEVETVLYRVAQEAVTNASRHATPGRLSVLVNRTNEGVTLSVEDDGVGFVPDTAPQDPDHPRLGLAGMRERVALVGGILQIESTPGRGTTVLVRIPSPRCSGKA
jgi:signal transduction histidine kinase